MPLTAPLPPPPPASLHPLFEAMARAGRWIRRGPSFSAFTVLSRWQADSPYRKIPIKLVNVASVQCGECRTCCEQGNVHLDITVDRILEYQTWTGETTDGRRVVVLARHPDGSCVYLDPQTKACTIYDRRPAMCRTFSCRRYADFTDQQLARTFAVLEHGHKIRDAARRLIARGG